jgi:alpha-L-fucosidase
MRNRLAGLVGICGVISTALASGDGIPVTVSVTETPLSANAEPMQAGKFAPTWDSLQQYQVPEWYQDAKFGIWAHWGPQCEPEAGDWYARNMYIEGDGQYKNHLWRYGHPSVAGFKDIIPLWTADKWDPEKLVALYKDAGAKFFVAMAGHHDNFDNWDSKYQPWNSVAMGPKRDIIGGWAKAARDNGLPFGVTMHQSHAWNWYGVAQGSDKSGPKEGVPYDGKLTKADGAGKWWDGLDPQDLYAQNHAPTDLNWDWNGGPKAGPLPDDAYCEKFYDRALDLINKYHPDLLYFDDDILPLYPASDVGLKIAAHFYNSNALWHDGRNEGVLLGKNLDETQKKSMVWDIERGAAHEIEPVTWQSETCIGDWHYNREIHNAHTYGDSTLVVHTLADVVSKNGVFLLNIPVRADGTIDEQEEAIAKNIGHWMKTNGEAIYATRPWKVYGEGPGIGLAAKDKSTSFNLGKTKTGVDDIRFTKKGNVLYAIVLGWPRNPVTIHSLGAKAGLLDGTVEDVSLLGDTNKVDWKQDDDAVIIQPPARKLFEEAAVYKLTIGS